MPREFLSMVRIDHSENSGSVYPKFQPESVRYTRKCPYDERTLEVFHEYILCISSDRVQNFVFRPGTDLKVKFSSEWKFQRERAAFIHMQLYTLCVYNFNSV